MDRSLQRSIYGIFQARVPEWVAISFSRRSSQPRDPTWVSRIVGRCFTIWATREDSRQRCHCSSVTKSCSTLCDPVDSSKPSSSVLHYILEFAQTHVHWVSDAIQLSHPLLPPSPPAFNLSLHQGLVQWVGSLHQVAKVLELQLQQQTFQWIFRTDFLYLFFLI